MTLRERKKREVRGTIRAAALELFIAHGFDNVSVDQIAAQADVSRATFFNYFPSKESVVFEPDADQLAQWQEIRDRIAPADPLWQSLTTVIVESLADAAEWISALKRLCAASPELALRMFDAGMPIMRELRVWLDERVEPRHRAVAHLQLASAHAAVSIAFQEWDVQTPYRRFVKLMNSYLDLLGEGFAE